MYKLCFYVPESHLEAVKSALFAAGAGRVGNYECCCWQTAGQGQFRPLKGSVPFIGRQGALQTVVEFKVEMVFADEWLKDVVAALKKTHPYEQPAFDVCALLDVD